MYKLSFCLISIINLVSGSTATKYRCSINKHGDTCTISGLNLTRINYDIEPETDNVETVTEIVLNGKVPVFSSAAICDALPNLEKIFADDLWIEEIVEDAFVSCKKLTRLSMLENNFTQLKRDTFKGLTKVNSMLLRGGNIPKIDLDLSDMKRLEYLQFTNMNINDFPANTLREQENLEILSLYSNNLFDLDVETMLKYTPKLYDVNFIDNNFKCSRLREFIATFEMKNVTLDSYNWQGFLRQRNYTPEVIDGTHCLSDELWDTEISKVT